MITLTFFQGFVTGALIAMVIIFILMAVGLKRMKTEVKTGRDEGLEHSRQSLELMRERNEQEKQTQVQLERIADCLSEFARIYRAR